MRRSEFIASALGFALVGATVLGAAALIKPVRVAGGSMRPALHTGDVALIFRRAEPSVGDIALIDQPGHGPVLHRVIARDGSGRLRTKGDANPIEDLSPVDSTYVGGCVVAVVPLGELAARWRR